MSVVGRAAHWPGLGNHFCSTVKGWLTPVRSPQSNGMAESFVKTMKRDYVAHMPKPDRETALRNLAIAFEHYNEQHPLQPTTPLPLANSSPCRVCKGPSPQNHQRGHYSQADCDCARRAMSGAHKKGPRVGGPKNCIKGVMNWRFTSIRRESRTSCIHPRQLTRIRELYIIDFIDN